MRYGLSLVVLTFVFGCGQQTPDSQTASPGGAAQTPNPAPSTSPTGSLETGPVSTGRPANSGMPPSMPTSNLPPSKAVPANVKIAEGKANPTAQLNASRQREVTTSDKSDGPCGWKVEPATSDWAKQNMDVDFLKQHAVEAILSVSEDEVKAWKVDGSPHPDFEGYIRLKLQSNDRISIPMKFKKKTRIVVVKIPQRYMVQGGKASLNVQLNTNDNGSSSLYELSNGDLGGSEYRFQYIVVTAPKEAKYAAIPASINISGSTQPVEIKAGTSFTVAGETFEITAVRPFQKSDLSNSYGGYIGQQKFFTTVIVKAKGKPGVSLQGNLAGTEWGNYDPNTRITIDDAGNIVKEKVDPSRGFSRMMMSPMLQTMGGNASTGEIYLIANVNSKFVKSATFMSSATVQATLENIPLEK